MSKFVGHHAPGILGVIVLVLIGLTIAPELSPMITWYVLVVLLAAAVVVAGTLFSHNRGLCGRCIAAVPLDASAAASRRSIQFRIAHLFENKVIAFGYLLTVVATSLLYFHPIGKYVWAAAQLSLVYLLLVYVTHQRLQPWCPYCRNGGQDQVTPVPPRPVSSSH